MIRPCLNLITSNGKKVREFKAILGDNFEVVQKNIELPEIQGETSQIVANKVLEAYRISQGPVIVEDTSLIFNALNGMPGPYVKWFLKAVGPQGLSKMVDPYDDKSGYALCAVGLMSNKLKSPKIFIGKTQGSIVKPRGNNKFGWDPIFQPYGYTQTYAQMDPNTKNSISHRSRAIAAMCKYLNELTNQQRNQLLQ